MGGGLSRLYFEASLTPNIVFGDYGEATQSSRAVGT